jgi:hypothetical protein
MVFQCHFVIVDSSTSLGGDNCSTYNSSLALGMFRHSQSELEFSHITLHSRLRQLPRFNRYPAKWGRTLMVGLAIELSVACRSRSVEKGLLH